MTTYNTILYSVDQSVALVRLNRPDRRNALTSEMLSELHDAMRRAGEDATVRAIILTGEGPTFCAGQDLAIFTGSLDGSAVRDAIRTYYKPLILQMVTMDKIIIGAINGGAAGAGASLALACDLRIMAEDAYLLQAFSNIGLVPDAGSTWFMARLVGYSRALQFCIEAERITAPRCLELGLCNRIVSPTYLLHQATRWATALAKRPTKALGWTKQALAASVTGSLAEAIEYEADLQAQAIATADHKEGVAAFLQKRDPVFRGE
ncbi:MAG: enoyl-CoA hydratase/isomerase family protein [Caldilineaceae bacterium]|nr:enoyl-CoA hydratase/isomerase family protein [Caldilineaceae bacterium]